MTNFVTSGFDTLHFSYLNIGNINSSSYAGNFTYDETHSQAVSTVDDPYNNISDSNQNIEYTSFNKVKLIKEQQHSLSITYGINKERCITQYEDGNGYKLVKFYSHGNYESENSGNKKKLHYINAPTGIVAIFEKKKDTGQMYYVHTDHLGSYQLITNEKRQVITENAFNAWGRRRNPTDWTYTQTESPYFSRGYTGHEHLDKFGLINMNGRMFDPITARFLSPDIVVQNPNFTQSYNRYSYCTNNPMKYTDPSGWMKWHIPMWTEYQEHGGHGAYFAALSGFFSPGGASGGGGSYNASQQPTSNQINNIGIAFSLNGLLAQQVYDAICAGFNIFEISDFGETIYAIVDGEPGERIQNSDGGILFTNPNVTTFIAGSNTFSNTIDLNYNNIGAASFGGMGAAMYFAESISGLYEILQSTQLKNDLLRANSIKKITSTVSHSLRESISINKTTLAITQTVGKKLFYVGSIITIGELISDPSTENLIIGGTDLIMGIISISCPAIGIVYFSGRLIMDFINE